MAHVPYELLVDFAEGRLSPLEAAALRKQIASDPTMQQQLAELEDLIGLMHDDDSIDAPEHVIARAVRLARPKEPLTGKVHRLIALLSSDSWRSPGLAPGFRSLQVWPRAILLKAGDYELDLQVSPYGEQWQVAGQLLGPELPGSVTLSGSGGHVKTALNDLGEFMLPPVAGGRYTLTLTQGNLEIVVPNLEVGPSLME